MTIRSREDRRRNRKKVTFPLLDSLGNVVLEDRRRQPDRRMGDIDPELQEITPDSGQSIIEEFSYDQ